MVEPLQARSFERCINLALHGCETFDFAPADLGVLRERLRAYQGFSIHAPLPTCPEYPGHAATSFLLDPDKVKRQASLDMLRRDGAGGGRVGGALCRRSLWRAAFGWSVPTGGP